MTSDVAKILTASGNPIRHGSRVLDVDSQGNTQILAPEINKDALTPEQLETEYTDRFDDSRYYSGDTAS